MTAPALEFDRVAKSYRTAAGSVRGLGDVSLSVAAGEVVAVVGPSGSGKSTLLLVAAGFMRPDRGQVRFAGRDLAHLTESELALHHRRNVGFVSQAFDLMAGASAVDNAAVKLVLDGTPVRRAREPATAWLRRVGLGDRVDHTPEQLSGGQKQRVAIARALVNEPKLVLADEPTGSLDSAAGKEVLDLLAELARGRGAAVVVVTHDPQATRIADRVLTLRDGFVHSPDHRPRGADVAESQDALSDTAR